MTSTEQAILAGGCFWCTEAVMRRLRGVLSVESGYIGGTTPNPTYREVCIGQTGHAEAVRVTFDPQVVPYRTLLHVFFATHDPTTLNRQGADQGTQYRSALFPLSDEQARISREVMAELALAFERPLVTRLEPAASFYPAEAEHQGYYARNTSAPYCAAVISPKLTKLRQGFSALLTQD